MLIFLLNLQIKQVAKQLKAAIWNALILSHSQPDLK